MENSKEKQAKRKRKNINHSLKNFNFDGNKIHKEDTKKPTELRAVIYCRVSSNRQVKEGRGADTQEKLCRERCKNQTPEIIVDKVFKDEGVSGNLEIHNGFEDLVEYLKQTNKGYIRITHFVCRELSRVSRPDLDAIGVSFEMEAKVKQYGVKVVDINGSIDDSTDKGKMLKILTYAVAGYERKQIMKKCFNGKRARLLEGYRPFPSLPIGYIREKLLPKGYIDKIDSATGPIIKQGLELFANDPTMNQRQLFQYLIEKGLKGQRESKKQLHETYIEKMLQLHRIYFYAGYVIYPNRDINELIEGRQEALIPLETAEKIRKKITKGNTTARGKSSEDDFVLKQLITCKGCQRKLTGRYTKKPNGMTFGYYGCQCDGCTERANIPKDKLEQQVIDMIKDIQLSIEMLNLFDEIFKETWNHKTQDLKDEKKFKEVRLKSISIEKSKIERYLLKDDLNVAMEKTMSDKRATLDAEERILTEQLEDKRNLEQEMKNILTKTKELIKSPLVFWEQGDRELRKLLVAVRFGNNLIHSKEGGLQTYGNPVLYYVLKDLNKELTGLWGSRGSNPGPLA